jgi:aldose 1-epimerase
MSLYKRLNLFRTALLLPVTVLIVLLFSCGEAGTKMSRTMETEKKSFGHTADGREVFLFTLKNAGGISAQITNYGGIVTSLLVPDRNGNFEDVVLGFDTLEEYLEGHPYFGAIVGRYANRIAQGRFELGGEVYRLATNNGNNHLHGGIVGLDKRVWDYETGSENGGSSLVLTYHSPHGEEGYPGNLSLTVIYTLTDNDELKVDFLAETDRPTPVNLSHHGYFNLTGGRENVLGHELTINAGRYTEVNSELIPTGVLPGVEGTPMDFRRVRPIGLDIGKVPGGYDHNYVLDGNEGELRTAAILYEPKSGRRMEVLTTQPGVQLYTGNFLDGSLTGKMQQVYNQYHGLCLETQHFPDSPNHPHFPNTILSPGEVYHHTAVYRFSAGN